MLTNPTLILLCVTLFCVKHFIVDFPLQTKYQWANKGFYGHPGGLLHAGLHVLGSFFVLIWFTPWGIALSLAFLDGLIHYHVDWLKVKVNNTYQWTPANNEFWWLLGLDQLCHYLTYVLILLIILK